MGSLTALSVRISSRSLHNEHIRQFLRVHQKQAKLKIVFIVIAVHDQSDDQQLTILVCAMLLSEFATFLFKCYNEMSYRARNEM